MEQRLNGERNKYLRKYEYVKHAPYDYKENGLLNKIISPAIYNTKNVATRGVLRFVEYVLVWLMKYVDELKNFKNPHFHQR